MRVNIVWEEGSLCVCAEAVEEGGDMGPWQLLSLGSWKVREGILKGGNKMRCDAGWGVEIMMERTDRRRVQGPFPPARKGSRDMARYAVQM